MVGRVGCVVVVKGLRSFDDGDSYTVHLKGLDMPHTTFDRPDLSAFARLDGLGLELTGQRMWSDYAVLACRISGADRWCRRCESQGASRDMVIRRPAHEPYGWLLTILHVSASLPVPGVRSRVESGYELRGRSAREALAGSGALGADGRGCPPFDSGAYRPGPRCVLEEPPTPLS